jgi:hypothetical protein
MRKILAILLSLTSATGLAQDLSADKVEKLISDKSFLFVSTATFNKIEPVLYNSYQEARSLVSQIHPAPSPILIKDRVNIPEVNQVASYANTPSVSERISKSNTTELAVLAIDNESAIFDVSVIAPTLHELIGADPADLAKPLAYTNYSAKTNKKGKWTIRFDVQDERFKRNAILKVSPDGQADLTVKSARKSYNDASRTAKYYKGYITEITNP